jgi:hypothetical protein
MEKFAIKIREAQSLCCHPTVGHGCQMVYYQTKIPILGKFWMALKWKVLVLVCCTKKNLATLLLRLGKHTIEKNKSGLCEVVNFRQNPKV